MAPAVYASNGLLLHKTITTPLTPGDALAQCLCGWSRIARRRRTAQTYARQHRDRASRTLLFHPAAVSDIGRRRHNADAYAIHVDDTLGRSAWAVADGIGDSEESAEAAAIAATTAARAAVSLPAVDALLLAAEAVYDFQIADTVLVVATALPASEGAGYDIAWVGDCRAWEWNDTGLAQLTVDHTQGQRFRDSGITALQEVADRYDHVVLTTAATATSDTVGRARTHGTHHPLLLATDGVGKAVPRDTIARAHRVFSGQHEIARRLVHAAAAHGGRDNATALAIKPVHSIGTRCDPQPGDP